ncbi:hypothetical protein NDU88_004163 [Pleurodeles waltl]|uniref:Uncharacterized protein n=1 Tax=Pleurodeles waltl TaxID=8319 RepID=A0AAV7LHH8_PLEWA|nr:hypothetical protein NDU88_004163 [Pleurodeles waltl]
MGKLENQHSKLVSGTQRTQRPTDDGATGGPPSHRGSLDDSLDALDFADLLAEVQNNLRGIDAKTGILISRLDLVNNRLGKHKDGLSQLEQ